MADRRIMRVVMTKRLVGLFFILAMVATPALALGDDAPAWLRQAAALTNPVYDKTVSTVVLVDDSTMTVSDDGHITTVSTYAVRILNREGRNAAIAEDTYETDMGKVREIKAWLIRPSGQVKSYGKDSIIDRAVALNDVYDESRLKMIVAVDDVEPGSVFGYQRGSSVLQSVCLVFSGRRPGLVFAIYLDAAVGMARQRRNFQPCQNRTVSQQRVLHLGVARPAAACKGTGQPQLEQPRPASGDQLFSH